MVDTLTLVLAGVLLYTLLAMAAKRRGLVPDYVRVQGPITTLHTERGKAFLDWLSAPKRFWRAWGNFGVGVALVVMVGSFLLLLFAGVQALTDPQVSQTPLTQPRNVLAIPGVNSFLPLSAAVEIVTGLLIGLVVHEGGHGLMSRVEDIEIDSMGIAALAFVPIGAFVEPDEESRRRADRGSQTRMFAAGVTNNFAVAVLALALLFGPVVGSIATVPGVAVGGVLPGSPAAKQGIDRGDVITSVNGTAVANQSALDATLAEQGRTVRVGLRGDETVTVTRSLLVTGSVVGGSPLPRNTTIVAVNGTEVHTEGAFFRAIQDREVATLRTANGTEVTAPLGAYAVVLEPSADGPAPLAAAGAPPNRPIVITRIDDARIANRSDLAAFLDGTSPGQTVRVVTYVDGEREVYEVTLADHPRESSGFLGIGGLQPGTSGMTLDDFGIDPYPADLFLGALGGPGEGFGIESFALRSYLVLTLPFAKFSLGVGHNFPGFVGVYENFYTAAGGPLSFLGTPVVLFVGSLLFWTAWINVIIGQFNLIPAFPLDGGHILRSSTEALVSRLPVRNDVAVTKAVTTTVGLSMLASLLLMLFGGQIVGALS